MKVRLIAKTEGYLDTEYDNKSLDEITVGIARLSSSREMNDLFLEPEKLLRHCITNGHWSVFTTTNLVIEVITSRAIGRELLRHWSLKPQEISQRYAEILSFEDVELRKQSKNNRQSSTDIFNPLLTDNQGNPKYAVDIVKDTLQNVKDVYQDLLNSDISKETSRMVLPETTQTKIIFNGTLRDWITTLNQRLHNTAQKEARLVCESIRDIFIEQCPIISQSLYNFDNAYNVHVLDRVILEKFKVYEKIDKKYFN
jgi:flavin-dependent thymidylate synthase